VTPEEITKAINRGVLVINAHGYLSLDLLTDHQIILVSTMKCISYDTDFQKKLAEDFPLFVPDPPKPKKEKEPPNTKGNKGSPTKRRDQKRKREVDADEEDETFYKHRGTRSRPIVF
jgi:hypothetical protein